MQNKLLDFMSLQIQNRVLDFLRAKVVVHRIMVLHVSLEPKKFNTCPSNKMSKPRVK